MAKHSGILIKADIRLFLAIAVAFCLPMQCAVLGENRVVSEGQALKILTEAQKSALEMLHSGKATGRYLQFYKSKEDHDPRLITKARVSLDFSEDKYHIHLDYEKEQMSFTRRTIVYDGKILMASSFRDDTVPPEIDAEVCATMGSFANPILAGFPWNPSRLSGEVLDFATVIKAAMNFTFTIRPPPENDIEGTFFSGKARFVFHAGPSSGYNVSRLEGFNPGSTKPDQSYAVDWETKNGLWFVKGLVSELGSPDSARFYRDELHYDSFEPNLPLTDAPFQIGSLDLPPGARIRENLPGVPPRSFYYSAGAQANQAELDDLVAKLHSPAPAQHGWRALKSRWLWVAAIACCMILGGLVVLIARRRRQVTDA